MGKISRWGSQEKILFLLETADNFAKFHKGEKKTILRYSEWHGFNLRNTITFFPEISVWKKIDVIESMGEKKINKTISNWNAPMALNSRNSSGNKTNRTWEQNTLKRTEKYLKLKHSKLKSKRDSVCDQRE